MDNKDALQIQIDEAKTKLSQETLDAINAIDWRATVLSMREKKGYSFSQLEDLELATELLLYGLLKPEGYQKDLEEKMKISKEDSNELVNQLNELIFNKIRNELVKNSEKRKVPITSEKPTEIKIENQEEKATEVLDQSGIQIVQEVKNEEKPEIQTDNRADMLSKVENPEPTVIKEVPKTPSMLAQKLTEPVKTAPSETKYTDDNTKRSAIGLNKVDPYRENVE